MLTGANRTVLLCTNALLVVVVIVIVIDGDHQYTTRRLALDFLFWTYVLIYVKDEVTQMAEAAKKYILCPYPRK